MIEEKDLDGLNEYKGKYMNKSRLLNSNSITQMVKIKDINILRAVYKLFLKAKEEGAVLIITIYNDIAQNQKKDEIYEVLNGCLINAFQLSKEKAKLIDLKISSNENGLCFNFENETSIESDAEFKRRFPHSMKVKNNNRNTNVIYNKFYQNARFIQEIFIPFNR